MRCFIALPLPPEVRDGLARGGSALKARLPRLRWTSNEGYHLTLAFLGEIGEREITCARRSLTAAAAETALRFGFSGLGVFPEGRSSSWRVLYARCAERLAGASERVHRLVNEALAEEARRAGLGPLNPEWPNGRPFSPHITLARAPRPEGGGGKAGLPSPAELNALAELPQGEWTIGRCVLYKSELRPSGSVYEVIDAVAFAGRD